MDRLGHNQERQVTRRALLSMAAVGGLLSAACGVAGGSGATEKSPIEGVKPTGTINWSFWAVSQEQADNQLAQVKAFNAQQPDVKVEAIWVLSGDYRSKIISLISAGTPPELTQVDAYDMSSFVSQNLIQRMDPYMKGDRSFKLDDFLPGAFLENHHVFKGAHYSVPNGPESPRVLFYNKTKWKDAGLPLPNQLEEQGRWTWDAFVEHLTRVTQTVGANKNWGIAAQLGVDPGPHSWISSNNGKTMSDDLKTFVGDTKDTIDALQFQADLIHRHKVAPTPSDDLGTGDTFLSGRIAMKLDGAWAAAPLFTRPDIDYGIAPLPKSPKGIRKTVVKPNSQTIPTGVTGAKAAAAWELAKYITSPAFQKGLIDAGQNLTNRKDQVDYFLKTSPIRDRKVFMDAYDKKEVVAIPLFPKWRDYNIIVGEEMTKVRRGELNVQTALGSIKSRANDLLKS